MADTGLSRRGVLVAAGAVGVATTAGRAAAADDKPAGGYTGKAMDAKQFLSKHPMPVLLHFQPEKFMILEAPDDLRKWEADLAKKVGLKGLAGKDVAAMMRAESGTCCESGDTNDCDAD